MLSKYFRLAASAAVCCSVWNVASAQSPEQNASPVQQEDESVFIRADRVINDAQNRQTIAEGNVEVHYGPRVLRADRVIYDMNEALVRAQGNVQIIDPDGTIRYAEEIQVDEDLENGYALNFATRMTNGATATAGAAIREEGSINAFERMVYTACPVCEDSDVSPTWSLRAKEAVQNQESQMMSYKDAILEIKGIPVLYIPYFTHPDPSSERRSGLLTPDFGLSDKTGVYYKQPYFWAATPYQDLTIAPTVYERITPLMELEYRKRFFSGYLGVEGSFTKEQNFDSDGEKFGENAWRSHIAANGDFAINRNWRWGFAVERQSDDLYDLRYDLDTAKPQTGLYDSQERSSLSQLYTVGQGQSFYTEIGAMAFQGLRESDDPGRTPHIAPSIYAERMFDLGRVGRLSVSGSSAVLERDEGVSSARGTAEIGWRKRNILGPGFVFEPFAEARGDAYEISDTTETFEDGTITRGLGLFGAQLSWPLIGGGDNFSFTIEPRIMAALGTNNPNNDVIPNEDGLSFEAGESSLFLANAASGYDRWEGGNRASAGISATARWGQDSSADFIFGRRWRERADPAFSVLSNLEGTESDYVAAVGLSLGPSLNIQNSVRLDKDDLTVQRLDTSARLNAWRIETTARYFSLSEDLKDGGDEGLILKTRFRLTDNILGVYALQRNFTDELNLSQLVGVAFEDDCSYFQIAYERKEVTDRTLGPSEAIRFTFSLKTLGTIGDSTFD